MHATSTSTSIANGAPSLEFRLRQTGRPGATRGRQSSVRYLLSSEPLPTAPQSCGYAQAVDVQGGTFPVYRNVGPAAIGDCTAADQGHRIQVWSANAGMLITPTSSQVLSVYEAVSGYNPAHRPQ